MLVRKLKSNWTCATFVTIPQTSFVNLRTKESKTIGLIIPEVVHHFSSNVVNAIIDQAEKMVG
jgi:DNA-binding LacI/PurR family transcriptional regulator